MTNLRNLTQPLIRYELTDRFAGQRGAANGQPRVSVEGRADDVFRYGAVAVHPHVVRSILVQTPAVAEYQAHQTPHGVDLDVVVSGPLDRHELASRLRQHLGRAGLDSPQATVHVVDAIAPHPETGKVNRFVPLGRRAGGQGTKRTS